MAALLLLLEVAAALAVLGIVGLIVWRARRGVVASVCAHLGLEADPFARSARPDEAHRCYANLARERIDLGHQQRFCLAAAHKQCPFLATAARRQDAGLSVRMRAWWRIVSPAAMSLAGWLGRGAATGLAAATRRSWPALRSALSRSISGLTSRVHATASTIAPSVVNERETVRGAEIVDAVLPVTLEAPRVAAIVPADPAGPGLLNRVAAAERDLVERGIALLQDGGEDQAYACFTRATELDPRALRAWFWRAKTAHSLDELVHCLERAHDLDPGNAQVASNLAWATARRAAGRASERAPKLATPRVAHAAPIGLRRPALHWRALRLGRELGRAAAALAAFVVAAGWLLGALPPRLVDSLLASSAIQTLPVPATNRLTDLAHLIVGGGYDVASALPFAVGFLAVFVGVGLLSGDGWTRVWAPAIGLASAWAWNSAPGGAGAAYLLTACGAVVLGGALSGDWRVLRLD